MTASCWPKNRFLEVLLCKLLMHVGGASIALVPNCVITQTVRQSVGVGWLCPLLQPVTGDYRDIVIQGSQECDPGAAETFSSGDLINHSERARAIIAYVLPIKVRITLGKVIPLHLS